MKKKVLDFIVKYGSYIATLALTVTTITTNTACLWFTYQEELPVEAKKLKKF